LKIKGHSGCKIEIFSDNSKSFVRKSIKDSHYFIRLEKQSKKQKAFHEICQEISILVPQVYLSKKNIEEQSFYFDMNYYTALDCITFFQGHPKKQIDLLIKDTLKFIDVCIEKSSFEDTSANVLNKLESLKKAGYKNTILSHEKFSLRYHNVIASCKALATSKPLTVPVGICHGDLTFSNILVSNLGHTSEYQKTILIDFLDSFVETPMQDMVKLRQDTVYYWSSYLYSQEIDSSRLDTVFRYIDKKIHNHFIKYSFYTEHYKLFQTINLLRVLCYCKNEHIASFLLECTEELINGKFNNTSGRKIFAVPRC
jgi:thiamine kinase-like enzyme